MLNLKTIWLYLFMALSIPALAQQNSEVIGILSASNNSPLASATITVQENNQKAQSDHQGRFVLKNIKYGTYNLIISAVGYRTEKQVIKINQPIVQLPKMQLQEALHAIDEVEIIGRSTVHATPKIIICSSPDYFWHLLQLLSAKYIQKNSR